MNAAKHGIPGHPPGKPLSFLGRFRAYFLAGVLVTAPLGITFYLAWLIITFVDRRVEALLPARYNPEAYLPFTIPGLGVVIVVVFLIFAGAFAAGFVGRMMVRLSENLLARMPVIRTVYGAIKQIIETVLAQQSQAFRQVVLVEYPRRGIWAIAFVTGSTHGEVQNRAADEMINVFLPTTPNPTSGFLLFVPRTDVVALNMTVEEGVKMVISGGIITPPDRRPPEEKERPVIPHVEPTVLAEGETPKLEEGETPKLEEGEIPRADSRGQGDPRIGSS